MKKKILPVLALAAGTLVLSIPVFASAEGWKRDNRGWWYQFSDGSYKRSSWVKVNNAWYYMNGSGYMQTGWLNDGGSWYYLDATNGDMKVGWVNVNNAWYYLNPSEGGRMAVNTYTPGGYYVDANGVYQAGAAKTNNSGNSNNSGSTSASAFENKVIELVNAERAKHGVAPLSADNALMGSADIRAKELVSLFSHSRPDGSDYTTVLPSGLNAWGENVAMGQTSPEKVMESWMNSSGHRANILSSDFTLIGVGFYESGGEYYWVQNFGRR